MKLLMPDLFDEQSDNKQNELAENPSIEENLKHYATLQARSMELLMRIVDMIEESSGSND
ncbi:hypothetical protein VKT23_014678 [Stygiomarasmius scandens]|uniref:Uncharacterized protein n=1 Tax=Marasmiellus scandens TaxID=2682957 RepID=A0ABR1J001_9AGAR